MRPLMVIALVMCMLPGPASPGSMPHAQTAALPSALSPMLHAKKLLPARNMMRAFVTAIITQLGERQPADGDSYDDPEQKKTVSLAQALKEQRQWWKSLSPADRRNAIVFRAVIAVLAASWFIGVNYDIMPILIAWTAVGGLILLVFLVPGIIGDLFGVLYKLAVYMKNLFQTTKGAETFNTLSRDSKKLFSAGDTIKDSWDNPAPLVFDPAFPATVDEQALRAEISELLLMCDPKNKTATERQIRDRLSEIAPLVDGYLEQALHAAPIHHYDSFHLNFFSRCAMIAAWDMDQNGDQLLFQDNLSTFRKCFHYVATSTGVMPVYYNANSGGFFGGLLLSEIQQSATDNIPLFSVVTHEMFHVVFDNKTATDEDDPYTFNVHLINELYAMLGQRDFFLRYGLDPNLMLKNHLSSLAAAKEKGVISEVHQGALLIIDDLLEQGYQIDEIFEGLNLVINESPTFEEYRIMHTFGYSKRAFFLAVSA